MKRSVVALVVAGLAACGSPTVAGRWIRVRTSDTTFVRGSAPAVAYVPFSVTNGSAATVYLPACNGFVVPEIEYHTGVEWRYDTGFMCLAIFSSAPVALAPAATAQSSVSIAEPGRYRLRLAVSKSASYNTSTTVVSPPFSVR